jgi:hypothetical protein
MGRRPGADDTNMAVSLSGYNFPFAIDGLPDRDRAALAMVVTGGSAEQREKIAGPSAAAHREYAEALSAFVASLDITEPEQPFDSTLRRAQYLAEAARRRVEAAYPDLHPEVARRAGNLYAFLNR